MESRSEIDIFKILPFLSETQLRKEIEQVAEVLNVKRGETIVREGEYVKVLPFVLSGQIRVFQTKEEREILLYYVNPGQTCIMSLSACFFNNQSPSQAVAAEDSHILAIPTRFITQWQKEYNSWNSYVIRTFRNRYDELLEAFETVAFDNIDKRLLEYLKQKKRRFIELSHQQLAHELGTTRVVISRILKKFESEGLLVIHRAKIELI